MKVSSVSAAKFFAANLKKQKEPTPILAFTSKADSVELSNKNKKSKLKKALPIAILATLAGVSGGYYLYKSGKLDLSKLKLANLNPSKTNFDDKTWLAIAGLCGLGTYEAGKISSKDKEEIVSKIEKGETPLQETLKNSEKALNHRSLINKYRKNYYGIPLLNQTNALNKNQKKSDKALEQIQDVGFKKLTTPETLPKITSSHPTLWSITSEFAPIKEGGLGNVPPEIRNNMTKLGIDIPTFTPMYLDDGISSLQQVDEDNYIYQYKGKRFDLEKVATFKMDTYQDNLVQTIPVNIFLTEDTDKDGNKRQLVFVQADKYFDGTIYEASVKTEEPEKFAVMSKAIYEFLKLKTDGAGALKDVSYSSSALSKINAPDAMILNDWQASPIAALMRYKAPMENAFNQLSDENSQKIATMPIITIGHNVMYQGSTQANNNMAQRKSATSNILNTLFDKYSYDIVRNAKVHTEKIDKSDKGLQALDNVLLLNEQDEWQNHTNLLNMGIILSDYFHPVSQNYADELTREDRNDLSYYLQWALVQKAKAGKLVGIINGNDFNNLSIEAREKQIKNTTGVDFLTYNKETPLRHLINRRTRNKIDLYNNFILPFSKSEFMPDEKIDEVKKYTSRLEFVAGKNGTQLPLLSDEELRNTPILTSGGRLVSQKGVDILCGAIKMLFDNWDEDFKGYNKPIFYIAGSDGEGGSQRKMIEDLKDKELNQENSNHVLFAHGFAPMTGLMAGSDFFIMPSKFEPCGLTQGEALAVGTPVIASAVGGLVDTLNRNGKTNGILTNVDKRVSVEEFYKTLKNALKIYYEDKSKYQQMVKDSIDEDFSWIQPNKQGPVFEYLEKLGIDKNNLPEVV